MKFLLGALLLGLLFAAAVLWQRNWRTQAASEREAARVAALGAARAEDDPLPEGWGSVVVGAPSGAEPVGAEAPGPGAGHGSAPGAATPGGAPTPPPAGGAPGAGGAAPARIFELKVQRGQTLSTICQAHYGSARAELVQALARYNALADVDALREGQALELPPLETLLAKKKP